MNLKTRVLLFSIGYFLVATIASAQSQGNCPPPKDNSITCNYSRNVTGGMQWNGNNQYPVYYLYCVINCRNESQVLPKCTGERCTLSQPASATCPIIDPQKYDLKIGCTDSSNDCEKKAQNTCKSLNSQGGFASYCKQKLVPCNGCSCIDTTPVVEPGIGGVGTDGF